MKLYINLSNSNLNKLHPILKNFYKKLKNYYDIIYINRIIEKNNKKEIPLIIKQKGINKIIFNIKIILNKFIPRLNIIKGKYNGPILTANNFLITKNNYYIITSSLIQFSGLQTKPLYNKIFQISFKKLLLHKNLEKIFFYSQTAKNEFIKYCDDILKIKNKNYKNKLKFIYPYLKDNNIISISKIKERLEKEDKTKFLFVARDFLGKGGLELLKALKIIKEKYKNKLDKFEINIVSDIPAIYIEKLNKLKWHGLNINLYGIQFTQEELENNFYKTNHILLHLTRADLFGMVSLESKKNGLAVITTKQYLNYPELFQGNEALFVNLDSKYLWNDGLPKLDYISLWHKKTEILSVDDIVKNIIDLVENKKKLEKLAINNLNSLKRFENKINLGKLF